MKNEPQLGRDRKGREWKGREGKEVCTLVMTKTDDVLQKNTLLSANDDTNRSNDDLLSVTKNTLNQLKPCMDLRIKLQNITFTN